MYLLFLYGENQYRGMKQEQNKQNVVTYVVTYRLDKLQYILHIHAHLSSLQMLLSYSTKTLEAVEFASLTNGRLEFYSAKIILFDLRLIFMYCSGPLRRTPSSLESFYKDDLSLLFISFDIYIYTISEKSSLNSCAHYCNRGH